MLTCSASVNLFVHKSNTSIFTFQLFKHFPSNSLQSKFSVLSIYFISNWYNIVCLIFLQSILSVSILYKKNTYHILLSDCLSLFSYLKQHLVLSYFSDHAKGGYQLSPVHLLQKEHWIFLLNWCYYRSFNQYASNSVDNIFCMYIAQHFVIFFMQMLVPICYLGWSIFWACT